MQDAVATHDVSSPRRDRHRIILLIVIMTVVAAATAGITIRVLYGTAIEETRARLTETVQSQARLLEAVARFDQNPGRWRTPLAAFYATLAKIQDAHKHFRGFGETGEFSLVGRDGDRIVFLLGGRGPNLDPPPPLPYDAKNAEPMRRALSGQSGTYIGADYRGEVVVAAYEPVAILNLGIVAKIDLSEVRAPFVRAGFLALGAAFVLIVLGAVLFRRITAPLIRNLENRVAERTTELAHANESLRSLTSDLIRTEERERRRIATDLHDHVGPTLALIQMKSGALRRPVSEAARAKALDEISRLVDDMSESIRSLTFELSPPVLYELGLRAGLEWLVEKIEAEHDLTIDIEGEDPGRRLDEDLRVLLFRVVRELLVNVVKHARATSAVISLTAGKERVGIVVADDGAGLPDLPASGSRTGGFGLFSIRERMESVGGSVELGPRPGGGTRVVLEVPA